MFTWFRAFVFRKILKLNQFSLNKSFTNFVLLKNRERRKLCFAKKIFYRRILARHREPEFSFESNYGATSIILSNVDMLLNYSFQVEFQIQNRSIFPLQFTDIFWRGFFFPSFYIKFTTIFIDRPKINIQFRSVCFIIFWRDLQYTPFNGLPKIQLLQLFVGLIF